MKFLVEIYGKDIPQNEVAKLTTIDESTISKIFNRKLNITLEKALKFYEAFDIDLHWLLTGEERQPVRPDGVVSEPLSEYCAKKGYEKEFIDVIARLEGDGFKQGQATILIRHYVLNKKEKEEVAVLMKDHFAVHEHDP